MADAYHRPNGYTAAQLLADLTATLAEKPEVADLPIKVEFASNPVRAAIATDYEGFTLYAQR